MCFASLNSNTNGEAHVEIPLVSHVQQKNHLQGVDSRSPSHCRLSEASNFMVPFGNQIWLAGKSLN